MKKKIVITSLLAVLVIMVIYSLVYIINDLSVKIYLLNQHKSALAPIHIINSCVYAIVSLSVTIAVNVATIIFIIVFLVLLYKNKFNKVLTILSIYKDEIIQKRKNKVKLKREQKLNKLKERIDKINETN